MALNKERVVLELEFLARAARDRSPLEDGGSEARVFDAAIFFLKQDADWSPVLPMHKDGRRLQLAGSATNVLGAPVFGAWDQQLQRWRVEYAGQATVLHGEWAFTHQRPA